MNELKEFSIQERLEENIKLVERKTKINRSILLKITLIFVALLIFGIYDRIVSTILGIYFPIIWTLRSCSKEKKKQWYMYWLIYSFLNFIDLFSEYILLMIPFYFLLKSFFLIWLYLPNFNGADFIYKSYLHVLLKMLKIKKNIIPLRNEIEFKTHYYNSSN